MYRSEPSATHTLTLPRGSARTASFSKTSPWLSVALASVACLLWAQGLLALVDGPLVSALDEVQARVTAEAPAGSRDRLGRAPAGPDEPGHLQAAVCEQSAEPGVPPAPRWVAGWAR